MNNSTEVDVAKTVFNEMDKNQVRNKIQIKMMFLKYFQDGKITVEEFSSACLRQEEISKLLAIKIIDIFVQDS